jgi:hypothetical protein
MTVRILDWRFQNADCLNKSFLDSQAFPSFAAQRRYRIKPRRATRRQIDGERRHYYEQAHGSNEDQRVVRFDFE